MLLPRHFRTLRGQGRLQLSVECQLSKVVEEEKNNRHSNKAPMEGCMKLFKVKETINAAFFKGALTGAAVVLILCGMIIFSLFQITKVIPGV